MSGPAGFGEISPPSWLYVPGDRPDRFASAIGSGAGAVILDLEDSVAAGHKSQARDAVAEFASAGAFGSARGGVAIEVRVNAPGTETGAADLRAIAGLPRVRAIRLPKTESARQVRDIARVLGPGPARLHCLIESALGVEAAYEIATSCDRVGGIGLGEADLASDLGISPSDPGLLWARGRIVLAARAAGLPSPAMSVFPSIRDQDGLRRHCQVGRELGFVGANAIHPAQLPVIHEVFRPSEAEVADARLLIQALDDATQAGRGVIALPDGRMVDPAMLGRARRIIAMGARPG